MTASVRKPMVLFVAPYFPPACYGGAVQVYLGLLRDLESVRVVVVSDRYATDAEQCRAWDEQATAAYGFEVRRLDAFELHFAPAARSLSAKVRAARRFFTTGRQQWNALVAELDPDVIVCGGTYSAAWLLRRTAKRLPVMNYIHGEELTMQLRPRMLQPFFRSQQFRLLRAGAMNVCVSRYSAELTCTLARARRERIALLPNFVDTSRFCVADNRDAVRARFGWQDRLVLYTLARLEPRKGIGQTLRGLAQLHRAGQLPHNWMYVVAGRGPQRRELEQLAHQLGLDERVHFLGFVPDEDVAARYQAADIFIQTNREIDGDTEGFGIVFLEANACGVPVIGGAAGGTADAIEEGETGLRVDAEDVSAVAAAIRTLVSDPVLRRSMGQRGAARVRDQFTLPGARERFRSLLDSVLSQRSASGIAALTTRALASGQRGRPQSAHES